MQPVKLDTLPWAVAGDVGPRYGIGAPIKKKGGLDDFKARLKQTLAGATWMSDSLHETFDTGMRAQAGFGFVCHVPWLPWLAT